MPPAGMAERHDAVAQGRHTRTRWCIVPCLVDPTAAEIVGQLGEGIPQRGRGAGPPALRRPAHVPASGRGADPDPRSRPAPRRMAGNIGPCRAPQATSCPERRSARSRSRRRCRSRAAPSRRRARQPAEVRRSLCCVGSPGGASRAPGQLPLAPRLRHALPRVESAIAPVHQGQGRALRDLSAEVLEARPAAYQEAASVLPW
jgi:hypothetical protein